MDEYLKRYLKRATAGWVAVEEHPEGFGIRLGIAHWTGEAGDPVGARDQYAERLPILEGVFGSEHPVTLGVRFHVADWTEEAGDPVTAQGMLADLLPVVERVLGQEHELAVTVRDALAGQGPFPAGRGPLA